MGVAVGDWVVLERKAGVVGKIDAGKLQVELFEGKKKLWRTWSDVEPMFGEPRKAQAEVGDFVRMADPAGEVGQVKAINGGRISVELASKGGRVWRTFGDIAELPRAAAAALLAGGATTGATGVQPVATNHTSITTLAAAPSAAAPSTEEGRAPVARNAAAGAVDESSTTPAQAVLQLQLARAADEPTGVPAAPPPDAATAFDAPVLVCRAKDVREEELIKARAMAKAIGQPPLFAACLRCLRLARAPARQQNPAVAAGEFDPFPSIKGGAGYA